TAGGLCDLDRQLDRAFLVRADRVPDVPGVHLLPVLGQQDLAGCLRDPLDAYQYIRHLTTSGSARCRGRTVAWRPPKPPTPGSAHPGTPPPVGCRGRPAPAASRTSARACPPTAPTRPR